MFPNHHHRFVQWNVHITQSLVFCNVLSIIVCFLFFSLAPVFCSQLLCRSLDLRFLIPRYLNIFDTTIFVLSLYEYGYMG
jgi:uncharacterized protein YqhQ